MSGASKAVSTSVVFAVRGTPAAKGSARAFVNKRTGRAFVAPGGAKSTELKIGNWNSAVREAAAEAVGDLEAPLFVDRALNVTIDFAIARPSGHWGKGKNVGRVSPSAPRYPRSKPDIDKLARCTLDAITGIVFDDDSRIVTLHLIKRYADPGDEGATIGISEAT